MDVADEVDEPGSDKARLLATVDWLGGLDSDVIDAVAAKTRLLEVPAGRVILERFDHDRNVYVLIRGRVRFYRETPSGRRTTYDDLGPGAMFGELAAIDGLPHHTSVSAENPCTLGVISDENFMALFERYPTLAGSVMQQLACLARRLADRVAEYHTYNVRGRIYLELVRMNGSDEPPLRCTISARDMAGRVGTTREIASRVLADLGRQGIVSRDGNRRR